VQGVRECLPFVTDDDTPLPDKIMAAYNLRGLAGYTADEVAQVLDLGILTVRPRVTELFQAGKLRKTQVKRTNRSGIGAVVLVSTRVPTASAPAAIAA
jgi:hypothetical protein